MAQIDLNDAEQRLCAAFPRGSWLDLRTGDAEDDDLAKALDWPTARVIRAEIVRSLLLGVGDLEPGYAPAVRLRGARITGRLDLMGATVSWPLICEFCYFDEALRFVESSTKTIRIVDSYLPTLNGTRMRLTGLLNLWGCTIPGVLRIEQARVTGQACVRGAVIGLAGSTSEALAADGLTVDGGIDCVELEARGSVSFRLVHASGSVDLGRAKIICPGQHALIADNAQVGGRFNCRELVVEGETRMHNTRLAASLVMSGAKLSNAGGVALSAGGLAVEGGVFLNQGFAADGGLKLFGAHLGANLALAGAAIRSSGDAALNLDRASIGIVDASGMTCSGRVSLISTQVASDVNLREARLEAGADGPALVAERAVVGGALILYKLSVRGELDLRTIRVGQRLLLGRSKLENPGGIACRLSRAQIAADVFCEEMTAVGGIRLAGAAIGGEIGLGNARISNSGAIALDAPGLHAREVSLRTAEPVAGLVDLSYAQIEILRDDPACWPAELRLEGTTYQALDPWMPARQRLRWLDRDPGGHQQHAYEQLAFYYNSIGQPSQAREVMYARERIHVRARTPLARAWSVLQDVTVGYGYRPSRALAWLMVLLAAGSVTFALRPPPPFQTTSAPHFNPVIYTLDLLLPVVNLGQKDAFNPSGAEQWLAYLLIAGGWVLVTTIAAGAARVLRRR
jgi:hypothetical protein